MTPSPQTTEPSATQPSVRTEPSAVLYRWLFPLMGVISLLVSCVVWSLKKQLWADEIFTRTELGDPSFVHLLRAVPHLGGGGMPLFYLTGWPWAHVFGLSDLSLRLYSSVAICAAFLLLLATLRRRFTASAIFLGVAFGLFACFTVVDQNDEARGYGLYLLLCVLAIAQWLRIVETRKPRPRDLALLAFSQAGLVLGHVLAPLYAGLMLLALVVADLWERQFRLKVYLCLMAGWLALIPWIPATLASMAVGRPHGWIPVPTLSDLATGFSYWLFAGIYFPLLRNRPAGLVLGWACGLFCAVVLISAAIHVLKTCVPARRAVVLLGLALLLGPLVFFAVSHVASPIYVERYMIPSALGVALLAASWVEQSGAGKGPLAAALGAALLLLPLASALLAKPIFLDIAQVDRVAAGKPLVCDWLRDFMVMQRYSSNRAALEYPLDWRAALAGPPAAVGGYHLMQNYRREGYLAASLRDAQQVFNQKSFVVLDESDTNWFHLEIENNPQFIWKTLVRIDKDHRLLEVEQRP